MSLINHSSITPYTLSSLLLISLTASAGKTAPENRQDDGADVIVINAETGNQNVAGAGMTSNDVELGPLGNLPLLYTPYSVTAINEAIISNHQAKSVNDLLKYSSSSQMQARGGLDVGRPQNRGMQGSVTSNSRLDGLNIVSTTAFPVEMVERLDIVNSLTGALYGPASPAGQFNFIQKRPTYEKLNRFTFGYANRQTFSGHADLGGYVDQDHRFGYRINLLHDEGEGYVNHSTLRRQLASLAFDWHISDDTVLELNASEYKFKKMGFAGGFGFGPTIELPNAPDVTKQGYGQSYAGLDLETRTASARLRQALNQDWSLSAAVGYQTADRGMRTLTHTILDNNGTIRTSLSQPYSAGRFRILSNAFNLNGHLEGKIDHDLVLSTTGYEWAIYSSTGSGNRFNLGTANINSPHNYDDPSNGSFYAGHGRYKSGRNRQQSVTVGDTLTFNEQWSVLAVVSQSWLESSSYAKNGGATTSQERDSGTSPTLSLMYRPSANLMTYIAYADSLEQGGTAPTGVGVVNEGQTLKPYRSQQWETGIKAEGENITLSAALFHLERPFAYVDPSDMHYKEKGNQVNRGIEFAASGQLLSGLHIYSNFTLLDPKLKQTGLNATSNKRVVGAPKFQANALIEYSYPTLPQLVYSANIHHTGKRAANDTNTTWAKSYTTLDLGMRYGFKIADKATSFKLSVNNVTNERYWSSIFPGSTDGTNSSASAFLGDPREVRAAISIEL